MEDFNFDGPLEIDARRDENDEENDLKATKRTTRKGSMTKFTATLLLLATQKMLPRQTRPHNQEAIKGGGWCTSLQRE